MSVLRKRSRHWAATVLTAVALVATPTVAAADPPHPKPSHPPSAGSDVVQGAQQLRAAKQQARAERRQLDQAKQAVVGAQAELTARAAAAKAAVDRYAQTMERVRRVQARQRAAEAALALATAAAERQQQRVTAFARAAYMSGGPISSFATVLTAGGPSRILGGAALLGQVSQSQRSMLDQLDAAQQRQDAAAAKADRAAQVAAHVAARADATRRSALVAMANQQSMLQDLSDAQAEVTKRVAQQESHVAALARQQRAAEQASIAEQRAALAAAWATMQHVGDSMPWATKAQGREVVKWAKSQLGVPYSWAGGDALGPTLGAVNEDGNPAGLVTRGFDCSGLTLYAWSHVGFQLDHYTGYQWVEGHRIPLSKLRAGDLVFFATDVSDPLTIHHVGIYVHGNKMIDAPHTGAFVRYDKVFVPGLIGAVRP